MISIISTGSIKRIGLAFFPKFLIFNHVLLNVLVSIKHTGFDQAKHSTGFKQNVCLIKLMRFENFCDLARLNIPSLREMNITSLY